MAVILLYLPSTNCKSTTSYVMIAPATCIPIYFPLINCTIDFRDYTRVYVETLIYRKHKISRDGEET